MNLHVVIPSTVDRIEIRNKTEAALYVSMRQSQIPFSYKIHYDKSEKVGPDRATIEARDEAFYLDEQPSVNDHVMVIDDDVLVSSTFIHDLCAAHLALEAFRPLPHVIQSSISFVGTLGLKEALLSA